MERFISTQTEKIYKKYRDSIRINVKELDGEYIKIVKTVYRGEDNKVWIVITLSAVS